MKRCICGKPCLNKRVFSAHQAECIQVQTSSAESHRAATRAARNHQGEPPPKRTRVELPEWMRPPSGLRRKPATTLAADLLASGSGPEVPMDCEPLDPAPANSPPAPVDDGLRRTRAGRRVHPTWKIRDTLPEEAGTEFEEEPQNPIGPAEDATPRSGRRLVILVTDYVRTVVNSFGLRRFYKRRPVRPPTARVDLEACYAPTADAAAAKKTSRSISDIIFPYPNLSSWRFGWHYTRGYKKTRDDMQEMQKLVSRPDFIQADVRDTQFKKIDRLLLQPDTDCFPWANEKEGWRKTMVTIGIPSSKKATQAARREAAAAQRRVTRHEPPEDIPPAHAIPGYHYSVAFHHRSMCEEIKKTLSTDPAVRDFVMDPYLVEHIVPNLARIEETYGEVFNSRAFVKEDLRLQNSPPEPGCNLPRSVLAIMLWSDATIVSQFGQGKAWPGYMYFGNQSKYTRARPTARAAHHIAFFPTLPDDVQDTIRQHNGGKAGSAALITHCRRELFHAAWEALLDDEFVHAYEHGMVIDCIDGVRRRVYPRIFSYSADYPEKMLLATLRDKGRCPCPRCLTSFSDIAALGTPGDHDARHTKARLPAPEREPLVAEARDLIYGGNYVVNSEHVENLLAEQSLVPVRNAFSTRLGHLGFNIQDVLVVDQLHEFELGIWKRVFSHLVRIVEAAGGESAVQELNERFRQVPGFAWTTVRKFHADVCSMKRLAARDFENILKCIAPCFDGLPGISDADNDAILTLLFVLAYWHALAKMRLHSDTSVGLLDDTTAILGYELRFFANVTCLHFRTRETQREYEARKRGEARRQHANLQGSAGSAPVHPPSGLPSTTAATTPSGAASSTSVPAPSGGRRPQTFNLNTIKMHFLGDYTMFIKNVGTTDSYTSQIGEHEHRRVKARWERTNNVGAELQVVHLDAKEARMHRMAQELQEQGLDIPGLVSHKQDTEDPRLIPPEKHHHIAQSQKNIVDLRYWQSENPHDPMVQSFITLLKDHLRKELAPEHPVLYDENIPVILHHDRVYEHATASINYTTYDLRRDQDIIHPSAGKADILVHAPDAAADPSEYAYPWAYARVLGIYHANVIPPGTTTSRRIDFFHVRWFQQPEGGHHFPCGSSVRRLEHVQFVPHTAGSPFGFVDPSHVLRACHLIPAFRHGRTTGYLPPSIARKPSGDWRYYSVNRFVDRDMFVRFLGCGIGHLDLQARVVDKIMCDGFNPEALFTSNPEGEESETHTSSGAHLEELEDDEEGLADDMEHSLEEEDDALDPDDLFAEL
ncbi:hypothetical protein C8T65DRAFT_740004 [Cerioporus squamosus]|nr:hypothetical protein C8T65DRAFT_740004 [Cerioporus squamosus]